MFPRKMHTPTSGGECSHHLLMFVHESRTVSRVWSYSPSPGNVCSQAAHPGGWGQAGCFQMWMSIINVHISAVKIVRACVFVTFLHICCITSAVLLYGKMQFKGLTIFYLTCHFVRTIDAPYAGHNTRVVIY